MIDRRALPGFAAGVGGLAFSVLGLVTGPRWLGAAAGACAVTAGLSALGLARSVRRSSDLASTAEARAAEVELERDRMVARAGGLESEAITLRRDLADSRRAESAGTQLTPGKLAGITDAVTGLFNEQFFLVTLDKRVSAARRGLRPLAVVLVEVITGVGSGATTPADPKAVAGGLLETLRDADTACRLDDGRFAMVLEDTPENGAVWTVERVRRRLAEQDAALTMWAGVACYPAHAFDASQILEQAMVALATAKDWRQDRIEVAAVPDD